MSMGYTKALTVDSDPTFASNSNTIVPSQSAVKTIYDNIAALTINGKYLSANITLSAEDVGAISGSIESGSNSNGKWLKIYDVSNNVVLVLQNFTTLTTGAASTKSIPFPISFPDTDYQFTAMIANNRAILYYDVSTKSESAINVSLATSFTVSTTANYNVSWNAIWIKS